MSYIMLDESKQQITRYENAACFAKVINFVLSKAVKFIEVFHDKINVPYSDDTCARWVDAMNECGFPAKFRSNASCIFIELDLNNYVYKHHLASALMLTRALYENGMSLVPEKFFQLLDTDPGIDKFDAIQTAHKSIPLAQGFVIAPTAHMIISLRPGCKNIGRDKAFANFAKYDYKLYDGDASMNGGHKTCMGISNCWQP